MPAYCLDVDITDMLPDLTGSEIASSSQRSSKLINPASAWIDSIYPHLAPFAPVSDSIDWLINSASHSAGDSSVGIDGGTNNPAAGEIFRVISDRQWHDDLTDFRGEVIDDQLHRVVSYSGGTLTYEPDARIGWGDNAPIQFGTPMLIRRAAVLYALHIAFQIMGENPENPEAENMRKQAFSLLQIPEGKFLAVARPESTSEMLIGSADVLRS